MHIPAWFDIGNGFNTAFVTPENKRVLYNIVSKLISIFIGLVLKLRSMK